VGSVTGASVIRVGSRLLRLSRGLSDLSCGGRRNPCKVSYQHRNQTKSAQKSGEECAMLRLPYPHGVAGVLGAMLLWLA
jgi:hypothetical protein